MSNSNDQRILALKKQIETKKKLLGESHKFSPVTHSVLILDDKTQNIQVLNKSELIELLVKLNSYLLSAKDLGVLHMYVINGYPLEDWIKDVQSRFNILSQKEEEKSLKAMELKLTKLLSDGKKVELELDEIESLI